MHIQELAKRVVSQLRVIEQEVEAAFPLGPDEDPSVHYPLVQAACTLLLREAVLDVNSNMQKDL